VLTPTYGDHSNDSIGSQLNERLLIAPTEPADTADANAVGKYKCACTRHARYIGYSRASRKKLVKMGKVRRQLLQGTLPPTKFLQTFKGKRSTLIVNKELTLAVHHWCLVQYATSWLKGVDNKDNRKEKA